MTTRHRTSPRETILGHVRELPDERLLADA